MRGNPAPAAQPETYGPPQIDAVPLLAPIDTTPLVPAWRAATNISIAHSDETSPRRYISGMHPTTTAEPTLISQVATFDTFRVYSDEATLRSAAAMGASEGTQRKVALGLIEHHTMTMESTPVMRRPVPHSLMSNARFGDGREDIEGMVGVDGNSMVR